MAVTTFFSPASVVIGMFSQRMRGVSCRHAGEDRVGLLALACGPDGLQDHRETSTSLPGRTQRTASDQVASAQSGLLRERLGFT